MKFKIIKLLLLILFCEQISSEGFFTIIGPKFLRFRQKYQVSLTAQGYNARENIEISLENFELPGKTFASKRVQLKNGTQLVEFNLKDQPYGDYHLVAKSLSSGQFEKKVKLNMNLKNNSVFVQTDKAIYKPSDKVQFRVLLLDADMRPLKNPKVKVQITDGAENRIKQFDDVALTKGVFQSELQLSDSPVLGLWKIHVKHDSDKIVEKEFEVAEYVLPNLELTIEANPDANFKEGKITATIGAKYTFGKIATGNATISAEVLEINLRRNNFIHRTISPKVVKFVGVHGKKTVEFDIEEELEIRDKDFERTVKLFATFTEEVTGKQQNSTATVRIHKTPHLIKLMKSSHKFKPGLPFEVTAVVTSHDKKTPITDKRNPVVFSIKQYYNVMETCQREYFYQRDPSEPIETYKCREVQSFIRQKEVFLSNGFAEIGIELHENTTRIDVIANYIETEKKLLSILKSETESGQYIQTKLVTKKPILSQNVKIDVLATHNLSQLSFQVVAKGQVVVAKCVKVQNKKNHQIEFIPTFSMVPNANVIVFYITNDGEIISDSLNVEFGNELKNFIDIKLSLDEAKPGDHVDFSVHSRPNSFVGLLGIDQSVLLLKKGNDIEHSTVFEELGKYSKIGKINFGRSADFDHNTRKDFTSSDTVLITNAKREHSGEFIPLKPKHISLPGLSPVGVSSSDVHSSRRVPEFAHSDLPNFENEEEEVIENTSTQCFEIRKKFPETFLFESFDFNSTTSNAILSKTVPDTITSWIITGFSVDPIFGLGLTTQPSKLTVFQPFFVSMNLPYSIKQGEVLSISVIVFNYLDSDQYVDVTLFNNDEEFEFANVNEDGRCRRVFETQQTKQIYADSDRGTSVNFMIRPLKAGHITIKVVAESNIAGDGVFFFFFSSYSAITLG